MTDLLENLTINPEMAVSRTASSDLLSHVLSQIRLTGDRVYSCELARRQRLELETGAAHVCIVTEGAMQMRQQDQAPVAIETGDLVLLPRDPGALRLTAATHGATVIVCRFRFDPDSLRAMIFALPPCIQIRRAESAGWLDGLVHYMMIEVDDVE